MRQDNKKTFNIINSMHRFANMPIKYVIYTFALATPIQYITHTHTHPRVVFSM